MFVRPHPSSAPGHRHSPTQCHTARGTDIPAVVAALPSPGVLTPLRSLLIPVPASPTPSAQLRLHPPSSQACLRRCQTTAAAAHRAPARARPRCLPMAGTAGSPGRPRRALRQPGKHRCISRGPGENKGGQCSGGSGAAGCAAARIIRPGTAPGAPAAPVIGPRRAGCAGCGGGSARFPRPPHPGSSGAPCPPFHPRGRAHPG